MSRVLKLVIGSTVSRLLVVMCLLSHDDSIAGDDDSSVLLLYDAQSQADDDSSPLSWQEERPLTRPQTTDVTHSFTKEQMGAAFQILEDSGGDLMPREESKMPW